jgi:hypothetical protein
MQRKSNYHSESNRSVNLTDPHTIYHGSSRENPLNLLTSMKMVRKKWGHQVERQEKNIDISIQTYTRTTKEIFQRSNVPPINATYMLDIHIPVIGRQTFQLSILDQDLAELIIVGMLRLRDTVPFHVDTNGNLSFNLSDETKQILKKFRTNLGEAKYCGESDIASIVIQPPLPTSINLELRRKI